MKNKRRNIFKNQYQTRTQTVHLPKLTVEVGEDGSFVNAVRSALEPVYQLTRSRQDAADIGAMRESLVRNFSRSSTDGLVAFAGNSSNSLYTNRNTRKNMNHGYYGTRNNMLDEEAKEELSKRIDKTNEHLENKYKSQIIDDDTMFFYLRDGGKIIKNVPYYNQNRNETKHGRVTGSRMCQLTSFSSLLAHRRIISHSSVQLPDKAYQSFRRNDETGKYPWEDVTTAMKNALPPDSGYKVVPRYAKIEGGDLTEIIIKKINDGIPVSVSMFYKKGKGHVVTIIGYDTKGWIIHDPYGDRDKGLGKYKSNDMSGAGVHYNYGEYSVDKCYMHTLERKK